MAGKSKGGREIRKPKQAKKPKDTGTLPDPIRSVAGGSKRPGSK